MPQHKRIRTLLYGDQRVSPAELEILHTPALQRLYGLRQLGLTDRVFIDASHARIHHVVGVLAQVDKLVSAVAANLRRTNRELSFGAAGHPTSMRSRDLAALVSERRPIIRLIGLLHDLTHAPFGHTVEDEIRIVDSRHDQPTRQAEAFYRLVCQVVGWLAIDAGALESDSSCQIPDSMLPVVYGTPDTKPPSSEDVARLGKLINRTLTAAPTDIPGPSWRLSQRDLAILLARLDSAMTALLHLEVLHVRNPDPADIPSEEAYPFQAVIRMGLRSTPYVHLLERWRFTPHRDAYMLDVVGNTVCADLLDYAKRDSHLAGLRLDYDADRIAENFTLVSWDANAYDLERTGELKLEAEGTKDPFRGWCLRTAISLVSHKFRPDVAGELMNLLNVRFYLYERAVYHPTKCAAGAMLGTALQLLGWRTMPDRRKGQLPPHLQFVGDDVFLHDIRSAASFILKFLGRLPASNIIDTSVLESARPYNQFHTGVVGELLRPASGPDCPEDLRRD